MSQLIFQSTSGGSVTLNGTNTAATYNLQVPAADGTLLYQDTSGNITFNNVTITGLLSLTGTSALGIPVGNTAERPASPVAGQIRYNTDGGGLYEGYLPSVTEWYKFSMVPQGQYTIQYLAVAGGGGGGTYGVGGSNFFPGGGGGAGGVFSASITSLPATVYNIVIGAGGPANSAGSNTSISGVITVFGGGYGGKPPNDSTAGGPGGTGGSGGGGAGGPNGTGGAGGGAVPTQGNVGATGAGATFGGGGGGSGAQGTAPNGGAGAANSITGAIQYYGGGGGGAGGAAQGAGGIGGGGIGGIGSGTNGGNGTINTGGGGGGGGNGNGSNTGAGTGGSGVVILSMPTANYTGTTTGTPTVTTSGLNTILTFTISGSYTA